jgi:hypothetical protein
MELRVASSELRGPLRLGDKEWTMEDIRNYLITDEDDDQWHLPDDERAEYSVAKDEEVPFHIPRD